MKPLMIRCISIEKETKDLIINQPSLDEIKKKVTAIVQKLHPTHIAIGIPLDDNIDFISSSSTPAPLTIDEFTKGVVDIIHSAGVNVYYRGTFCGMERLYDFDYIQELEQGAAATAKEEGKNTWLGRIYLWLSRYEESFRQGDAIGIIPAPTNNAFNGHFFLSSMPDVQTNFLDFFTEVKALTDAFFKETPIADLLGNKNVNGKIYTGFSSNNYSEIISGWVPSQLFDIVGTIAVDYYGKDHTPEEMESDLRNLHETFRLPIFLSEWADISLNNQETTTTKKFIEVLTRLQDENIIVGLNYWGGWVSEKEGLLVQQKEGYGVNSKGEALGSFFAPPQEAPADTNASTTVSSGLIGSTGTTAATSSTITFTSKEAPKDHQIVIATPIEKPKGIYGLQKTDLSWLFTVLVYAVLGMDATSATSLTTNTNFGIYTPYIMLGYTVLAGIIHAVIDGK